MIPVEGHKNWFRDENSGAIINCDITGYGQYVKLRSEKKKQKEEERKEINQMKSDIDEIKSMLREILNGSKWN